MYQKNLLGIENKCTYLIFGDFPLSQATYNCEKCKLKEICSFCYEGCHLECNSVVDKAEVITTKFVCGCATRINHQVEYEESIEGPVKCHLRKFDLSNKIKSSFNCVSKNLKLCSFCAIKCYSDRGYPTVEVLDGEEGQDYTCECNNQNHPSILDFIFSTSIQEFNSKFLTNYRSNFHLFNAVLESGCADEFFEFISDPLDSGKMNKEFIYLVRRLAKIYKQHESEEIILYPGSKLINLLPFEKLLKFLKELIPQKVYERIFLLDLINIFYNLHLMPNMFRMKLLTTGDFVNSFIVERLSYNRFVELKNSNLIIDLLQPQFFQNIDYKIFRVYEILKVIDLFVRLMIFSEDELNKIIDNLYLMQKEFENIEQIKNFVYQYKIQDEFAKFLMKLSELLYILCIIKNDKSVDNIIYENAKMKKDFRFIHSANIGKASEDSISNDKLLEMIVKTQHLAKKLSEILNKKQEKKIFYLLRLSVNLFSSSNNIYLHQLNSLKNIPNNQNAFENFKVFTKLKSPQSDSDPLVQIKSKIDKSLLKNHSVLSSSNIIQELTDIFLQLDEDLAGKEYNTSMQTKIDEFSEYVKTILKSSKSSFSFLNKITTQNDCDNLIDTLIQNTMDVSFSNIIFECFYFQVASKEDEYFSLLIRLILDYFELFCLNRKGLTYLLLGKNLSCFIKTKIISYFPIQSLNLIFTIFKGIKHYGIDFRYQHFFSELTEIFSEIIEQQLNYWKNFYKSQGSDEDEEKSLNIDEDVKEMHSKLIGKSAYNSKSAHTRTIDIKLKKLQGLPLDKYDDNTTYYHHNIGGTRKISDIGSNLLKKKPQDSKSYEYVLLIMKIINISSDFINERDLDEIKYHIKSFVINQGAKGILNLDVLKEITSRHVNVYATESTNNKEKLSFNKLKYDSLNQQEFEIKSNNQLFIEENKFAEIRSTQQMSAKNSTLINTAIEFYFEFYKVICKNTYYNNYEEYLRIQHLLNKSMKLFLLPNLVEDIRHKKKIILRVIRSMAFSDFIDERNFQKDLHLTNEELENIYGRLNGLKERNLNDEVLKDPKYKQAKYNLRYIKYLTDELVNATNDLNSFQNEKGKKYLTDLLLTIKTISDYIYHRQNLVKSYFQPFFSLVKILLSQTENLTDFFNFRLDKTKLKSVSENLNDPNFNKMDFEKVYLIVDFCIENILNENIRKQNFVKILKIYDNYSLIDFSSDFRDDKKRFQNFYINFAQRYGKNLTMEKSNKNESIEKLKNRFNEPLKDFKTSVFYKLLLEEDFFTSFLIDDFINFISGLNYNSFNLDECIFFFSYINKMLFNSRTKIKNKIFDNFSNGNLTEDKKLKFLFNIKELLTHTFRHNFCSDKNYLKPEFKIKVINVNKNILTFLHSLSINHKEDILKIDYQYENDSETIFGVILENLENCLNLLKLDSEHDINMQYDKLIIQIDTMMEFIIEYIDTTDFAGFKMIQQSITDLLEKQLKIKNLFKINFDDFNFERKPQKFTQRHLIAYFVKSKIVKVLNRMAQCKHIKDMEPIFSSPSLHLELLSSFYEILHNLLNPEIVKNILTFSYKKFKKFLNGLLRNNEEFRNSLQFNYCLELTEYIKVMKKKFNRMRSFKKLMRDNDIILKSEEDFDQPEIKGEMAEVSKKYIMAYRIFSVLNELIVGIEIKREDNKICPVFFIKPDVTNYLSSESKENFENFVERNDAASKLNQLVRLSDYFLYEMIYYFNNNAPKFNSTKVMNRSNMVIFEIFNYIAILIHQGLIIHYYYRHIDSSKYDDSVNNQNRINELTGNYILGLIHVSFLCMVILLWFVFRFPLTFELNLISASHKKISIRNEHDEDLSNSVENNTRESQYPYSFKHVEEKVSSIEVNQKNEKLLKNINRNFSFYEKIAASYSSIVCNNEINIFFATVICVIVFLTTGSPLAIVIPFLFIFNLSSILYDFVIAIKMKWKKLLLIIIFTWMIIYIFSWISLLWLSTIFKFDDTKDLNLNEAPENFCTSSIQCIFFMIDWGFRSSGGIGDILSKMSYKVDPGTFFAKLFYNLIFYIIIIMVLGNIFLGVIVDALIELRKKKQLEKEDKINRCFICQLTRDEAIKRDINFDKHRNIDHNIWNYVYFLTYMKISEEKNFRPVEKFVKNLLEGDKMSWIPLEHDSNILRNYSSEGVISPLNNYKISRKSNTNDASNNSKENVKKEQNLNLVDNFQVDVYNNAYEDNNLTLNDKSGCVTPLQLTKMPVPIFNNRNEVNESI